MGVYGIILRGKDDDAYWRPSFDQEVLQLHSATIKVGGIAEQKRKTWNVCELQVQTTAEVKLLLCSINIKSGVFTVNLCHTFSQPVLFSIDDGDYELHVAGHTFNASPLSLLNRSYNLNHVNDHGTCAAHVNDGGLSAQAANVATHPVVNGASLQSPASKSNVSAHGENEDTVTESTRKNSIEPSSERVDSESNIEEADTDAVICVDNEDENDTKGSPDGPPPPLAVRNNSNKQLKRKKKRQQQQQKKPAAKCGETPSSSAKKRPDLSPAKHKGKNKKKLHGDFPRWTPTVNHMKSPTTTPLPCATDDVGYKDAFNSPSSLRGTSAKKAKKMISVIIPPTTPQSNVKGKRRKY